MGIIIQRPSGGAIPPTQVDADDISGCVLWIDLDQETGSEGDALASLNDWSTSGNDPAQATAANKPTLRLNVANGRKGAYFDGSNDYMTFPTNIDLPTNHTILIVNAPAYRGAYSPLLQYKQQGIYHTMGGQQWYGIYRSGDDTADSVRSGEPQVFGLWGASYTDYDFIHDYIRLKGRHVGAYSSHATSYLGTDSFVTGGQVTSGYIFELRVYDAKISETDLVANIDWLLYKWRGIIRQ